MRREKATITVTKDKPKIQVQQIKKGGRGTKQNWTGKQIARRIDTILRHESETNKSRGLFVDCAGIRNITRHE